jgi:hypothetical protein
LKEGRGAFPFELRNFIASRFPHLGTLKLIESNFQKTRQLRRDLEIQYVAN